MNHNDINYIDILKETKRQRIVNNIKVFFKLLFGTLGLLLFLYIMIMFVYILAPQV